MPQKILFAIQLKAAEEGLQQSLAPYDIISLGAVSYREAVIPSLQEHPADILLYRETLKGQVDTFELMKDIRMEFSSVRIVFIAAEDSSSQSLLSKLACLGIYDIISNNHPTLPDIVDFILHPRQFDYASKFIIPGAMQVPSGGVSQELSTMVEEPSPSKKHGRFKDLFGKITGSSPSPEKTGQTPALPNSESSVVAAASSAPEINLDTMRNTFLESARRTAQAEIPQLVQTQVELETASLTADITRKNDELKKRDQELSAKTQSIAELRRKLDEAENIRKNLESQLEKNRIEAEFAKQTYETELINLQTTKPPEWYHEQTQKWLAEREFLKTEIAKKDSTIRDLTTQLQALTLEKERVEEALEVQAARMEELQLAVPRNLMEVAEDTLETDFVTVPDDDMSYRPNPSGTSRTIAFLGTKHGVGNTTVAMNTAIALANCGYKTLYIELNRHFPMVNEFFDFTHIVRGLDTCIKAVQQHNLAVASQCIIRPHGITTQQRSMSKIYKRLPGPFHMLLYSNDFLLRCKSGDAPYIEAQELKDLLYFLTVQEAYQYVIIDLQPDDQRTLDVFLNSAYHVNKLVLTLTQDPHSITTAGYLITNMARSAGSCLIRDADFVVNQYSSGNKMSINRISDFLHVPNSRFQKISLDSKGYMDSCYSAVPYVLSKGQHSKEYIDLRMKLG